MPIKKSKVKTLASRSPRFGEAGRSGQKSQLKIGPLAEKVKKDGVKTNPRPQKAKTGSSKEEKKADVRKKISDLKIDVLDTKGKIVEALSLPKEIFGSKVNKPLIAQAVRVYLANQRRGTVSTKTRGEVSGSTRKIYRQKGTGRARHGAVRAPIFVHGGVALGPKPRDFSMQLPKKMRRAALFSAISAKFKDNEIRVVDGFFQLKPKTKLIAEAIDNLELNHKKKKILIVVPRISEEISKEKIENLTRSVRNIEGVSFLLSNMLSTYEVLNSKMLLFVKESISDMQKFFLSAKKNKI